MAKKSIQQMEKDEKKIIEEISNNANKSINEIARKCGFSRQKVWRIIKNLEKNKTIWGYIAVTDEEKLDKKEFIILIKRTNMPIDQKFLDKITKRELEKKAEALGIKILTSLYLNGLYDWFLSFQAKDIKDAKRFCENLNKTFKGYISEIHLLEKMFAVKKYGIQHPEINKINEFFSF